MKSTDFPPNVREFGKLICQFGYKHHAADVFRDFIDYAIACLLYTGCKATAKRLQDYYGEDYPAFSNLYWQLMLTMRDNLVDIEWFDALGTIYEAISSQSKKSFLGQFFTPQSLCDMMAYIQIPEDMRGKRVLDPSCGSGRTLLAAHVRAPGNEMYGQDLDPICAKMCAINMAIHGCAGYVVCGDTIRMTADWAYRVNPWPHMMMRLPHIIPVQNPNMVMLEPKLSTNDNQPLPVPVLDQQFKPVQLTLF
jgi:type I restriction enzyme M protein